MIVSYKTGAEFLQDNQTYLQKNPYLSTFFTLDAPLLQEAGKINYALRCEQGETRLLALKVEPYNLLLLGEEACVPELLRFLFDGGYEIKNYLCASELGYVLMQKMQSYGRCYEEALAMDFMEARAPPSRPHRRSRQPGKTIWTRSLTVRSGLSLTVGCSISRKKSRSARFWIRSGSSVPTERLSAWRALHRLHRTICGSCLSTRGMNTAGRVTHARSSTAPKMRF